MNSGSDFKGAVRDYWEDPVTVSIIDKNLHQIEMDTVARHLVPSDHLIDIGCGDGKATLFYSSKVRQCVGMERSKYLRAKAQQAASETGVLNLRIQDGDVLDVTDSYDRYDVAVTQRVLINLASWEEQKQAMINIHRMLKPGGRYIMVENMNDGFIALNELRHELDLSPIPQHWHNRFLDYEEFMAFLPGKYQLLKTYDFGLYYLLTRGYVSMFASFEGYGSQAVKDPIYEVADKAARILFERLSDRIPICGCRALGPIQAFVLRREPATL